MRHHIRREKTDPASDMWRTLRIGLSIGLILLLVLPLFIN
ncbi:hypothetical protein TG4357_02644 [Thalassovita gelatinovora]|uniref:Uncharacterized protein n=1 Tax=Thalassovita gelatinovora TaxID=53501 RepID=A0A0P1FFS5_THAGE|nr:hypothetical protein TG4357_02644 [Thalassovita gelatinovora]